MLSFFWLYSPQVLAQVNFGLNAAFLLGLFLVVSGALLYAMRSFRPELSRDQDIVVAAVGLLCGCILIFQGWRLDPILQFGQFLLAGVSVAFAFETIRLRSVTAEQARRSTPTVDRDRRASRVYRAEIDEFDSLEEEPRQMKRQLRGTADPRARRDSFEDEYARDERSASRRARGSASSNSTGGPTGRPPRKRRPRPPAAERDRYATDRPGGDRSSYGPPDDDLDIDFDNSREDGREEPPSSRPPARRPRPTSARSDESDLPRRPSKRRPSGSSERPPKRSSAATNADYADYQPIDPERPPSGDGDDDTSNFDY
ncbi:Ycf66 family protein [Rubidibacter lacunae KORDI 51-2]|uniref:Ycf66 family protein n=1 Tax=Rubidibacter lacunae KORDI 51-2 TaxID=582515 RepID=U5DK22_9CHRO|nr:Ycf66 family protein [Rubidibacter lacunae]ERN41257.1 Ycf66 family protein [Rubidibacter lacunae KORDI 51-2]